MSAAERCAGAAPEGTVCDCTFRWLQARIVKGSSGQGRSAGWLRVVLSFAREVTDFSHGNQGSSRLP